MNLTELRARQADRKEAYTADPSQARTAISASADFRDDGITATVDGWAGPIRAGLHEAIGGDGTEFLEEPIVVCAQKSKCERPLLHEVNAQ